MSDKALTDAVAALAKAVRETNEKLDRVDAALIGAMALLKKFEFSEGGSVRVKVDQR